MGKRSKRYREAAEKIEQEKLYTADEAFDLLKTLPTGKFDDSVDMAINLGVDPKHADQMVRGAIVLPHGTGKSTRVLVFAKGEKEKEALDAGADHVGANELAEKIQKEGWLEFDRVIATPDMMGVVGRLGRILGPRGLMPNPKLGTVTKDVGQAVSEQKAGKVEFRVEKNGIIHCVVGRRSFEIPQLLGDAAAVMDAIKKAKPASSKGTYVKKVSVSSTMGPGLRVDPGSALALEAAA